MRTYVREHASLSMRSLTLTCFALSCGEERSIMCLCFPEYFPTTKPMGLILYDLNGGWLKGPYS